MSDLFGVDAQEEAPEERLANKGYKINTNRDFVQRKKTTRESLVDLDISLFDDIDDIIDKPNLDELYISQNVVRDEIAGTNGLKSISLFTGGGGSMTGFAWAGYEDVMSVEFVKAARESLQSNYESFIVEPELIAEKALEVANEMGLTVHQAKDAQKIKESNPDNPDALYGVILTKPVRRKAARYEPIIDWAMTMAHLSPSDGKQFRHETNKRTFEHYGERAGFPIFGDDVRGLDPNAVLEYTGIPKGQLDVLEGSPPCFPAGTRVICKDRIRPIEEVEIGHEVLTHKGRWRKVVNTMSRQSPTIILDGGRIECTPDHPFYARFYSNEGNQINSLDEEPSWVEAQEMEGAFYATPKLVEHTPLPEMPKLYNDMESDDFWYFVGRWIGDGWMRHNVDYDKTDWIQRPARGKMSTEPRDCINCGKPAKTHSRYQHLYTHFCSDDCAAIQQDKERRELGHSGGSRAEIYICSSFEEHDELWDFMTNKMPTVNWRATTQGSIWRYHFNNIEFVRWLYKHFHKGAAGKTIPGWLLAQDEDTRSAFLRGYLAADGLKTLPEHREKVTTVSRSLYVGVRVLMSSLGYATSTICDIFHVGADTGIGYADGRQVNIHKQYAVNANKNLRYVREIDGLMWQKMRGATTPGEEMTTVYDITVEEDHSFVADGYVVHNCKSFSTSGLRERGWGEILHYSGERDQTTDDLFLEFLRILDGFRPRSFIAENVSGMLQGSSREKVLKPLLAAFREIGYIVDVKEFLISDYGVAQARPRIIFMGIRDDQVHNTTGATPTPSWPSKYEHAYTVEDAIRHAQRMSPEEHESQLAKVDISDTSIGRAWHQIAEGSSPDETYYQLYRCHRNDVSPTITSTSAGQRAAAGPTHPYECRKFTIPEYRALFGFPYDYNLTGDLEQQGERLGRCVPPFFMKQIAETLADILNNCHSTQEQFSFDERSAEEQVSRLEEFTFVSEEDDDE